MSISAADRMSRPIIMSYFSDISPLKICTSCLMTLVSLNSGRIIWMRHFCVVVMTPAAVDQLVFVEDFFGRFVVCFSLSNVWLAPESINILSNLPLGLLGPVRRYPKTIGVVPLDRGFLLGLCEDTNLRRMDKFNNSSKLLKLLFSTSLPISYS